MHCAEYVEYRVESVLVSVEVASKIDRTFLIRSFLFVVRFFWGEKFAVGAIDLAKAPKNALYLAKKPKKSPAAHEKCPVVDQKSLKLAPKNRLRRPLFWPKMGCIRPFFRPPAGDAVVQIL